MKAIRVAVVVAVAALCVVAFFDHRAKAARLQRAHVDGWFCVHRGTRCGGETPEAIESAWTKRETGYAAGAAFLLAQGAVAHIRTVRSVRS